MDNGRQNKYITLIGTPLRQSFAARMQNRAYEAMHLDLRYFYTESDETHLGEIIGGIRYMPAFAGCAVTKPNKVAVLQYLDELDPMCRMTGACNTVVKNADGRLIGYNTDGIGFRRFLESDTDLPFQSLSYLCIGAGGAGRAICFSLASAGVKEIRISDIRTEQALELAGEINRWFPGTAAVADHCDPDVYTKCDVLMNASGIGMGETIGKSPVPAGFLEKRHVCFDACYNPAETQFLIDAKQAGCRIWNGLGMSLYQGAAQIELWTGERAPLNVMRQELAQIMRDIAL